MAASSPSEPRRVAVYARLSVTTEESVSVERQLEAARNYAAARGWTIVATAVDDGVSATKRKPEDRPGWRSLLDSSEHYEVVIVWKIDRLARRVLDFLHADEALRGRGAGIVAVEDPIDMTSAQGRAFATMLAVFAEMEASAIAARVTAARHTIVHAGRRAGGRPPFGWMNVPNPDGPGKVLAKDPERIGVVEELARRALTGESIYSLTRWLELSDVQPRPRRTPGEPEAAPVSARWHEASVEAILRAPALAGLTPYRGDLVHDAEGLPVVDESVAILTTEERRTLLAAIDSAKLPGTRQKAGSEPALLYGLARCGNCGGLMYRATAASKYRQYRCKQAGCKRQVGIARDALEAYVSDEFLRAVGRFAVIEVEEIEGLDPAPALVEIEAAIHDTTARMGNDDADVPALSERLASLKAARHRARTAPIVREVVEHVTGETFAETWAREDDVEARRLLLRSGLASVTIAPGGGRGRTFDSSRVSLDWARA